MRIRRDKCRKLSEIIINEFKFKDVENSNYVGNITNRNNRRTVKIEQRMKSEHKTFNKYSLCMKNRKGSKRLKLKIYKTAITPIVA